ncbi:unnamed protein product [Enterobius vermicularis]|uniref:TSP1_spondin domain-containing protein n=1 Tax=Enterobius vermicularis TaxID=51028 RepID=A0A0N4VJ48_ENTVE|nr:unnamed protein product [Enterobius vermicularis]
MHCCTSTFTAVDGDWSEWTKWSDCSAKCGFSFQTRHRFCNNPAPAGRGASCFGLATMSLLCPTKPCKVLVNGQWSSWSKWSECSAECGIGTKMRTRLCKNPLPSEGGYPCFGANYEESLCFNDKKHLNDDVVCSNVIRDANIIESGGNGLLPIK